ncbi:xanthine dehydrogenase family protein molybdopterin-binding subunit [Rubricoccus marinus]|uniref:Aldehyde oxidase/xanthine dehydrogenase a/b hammerhead domain-containing protein n=1 Tax=Rubricoccus marinus TaxID=716817 RepID=A0A259TWS3_9BACT|nr:xanthine dehydrogenase family protein molybdopterin-binding subunit [Rubricoccus marinus]OZC02077.1 hypothetical protein BSZ36_03205 [Rubricoccus marinus]
MNTHPTSVIGQSTRRVTGPLKVSGQATYAAEFSKDFGDELAHAVIVNAFAASGRITSIDIAEAEAASGVIRVFTHENAPELPYKEPLMRPQVQPQVGDPLRPLQTDQIYFSGQAVAVVVAESLEEAEHAATLVRVHVDETPADTDLHAARQRPLAEEKQDTPRVSAPKKPAENAKMTGRPADVTVGDPDAAFESAAHTVDLEIEVKTLVNNPIEPHATIAWWEGSHLTVHDKNQWVDNARKKLALAFGIREQEIDLKVDALNKAKDAVEDALGVEESSVRVVSPFTGGGFGSGLRTWPHTFLAALAARELERPVRLVLSRQQMFNSVGHRPHNVNRVRLGADADGRLQSVIHEAWQETSVYEEYTMNLLNTTRMAYATSNLRTTYRLVPLNVQSPTSMRAPGEASGAHALELSMDALAYEIGMDPLELRRRNNSTHDVQGTPFSSKHLAEAYDLGAERIGWADRTMAPRSMRDGDDLIGLGVSSAFYPANRLKASASARLRPDGTAQIHSASSDMGPGTYVSMTMVAADTLGLPMEKVEFALGDSDFPHAPVHGGSMTMASVGPAVKAACEAAVQSAIKVAVDDDASPLAGAKASDVRLEHGELIGPGGREPLMDVVKRHGESIEATASSGPNKLQMLMPSDYAFHSYGCVFARVRVDSRTGEPRVEKVVAVNDVGKVINPKTAASQTIGGVVMGIGMALMEEAVLDPVYHRYANDSFAEYHVVTNRDAPEIEAHFVGEPDYKLNPLGARGVGEIATVGTSSAVVNALYHATGVRALDLPATLDKFL